MCAPAAASFFPAFTWSQGTELRLVGLCRSHHISSDSEGAKQWRQPVIPELRKLRQEDRPVGLRQRHRDYLNLSTQEEEAGGSLPWV